ncbi:MAG TPA: SurA N-terminal domain-containing protein [Candidatus Sulfotelmatobacter sp.]|nr:SurA N-terminal domain-containing protein [Candidatus Sulfotelmatobacter sp.]
MDRVRTNSKAAVAVLALTLYMGVWLSSAHAAQVIDRIVATVNGHIILQSDWDEALRYEALLNGRPLSQFTDDDRRAVLDRLIDQELLCEQMKSASFQHATEQEAAARVADSRKQYSEAATDDGWKLVLNKFGLSERDLVAHVQQEIDLLRLVDAHLRPTVQIDSKTIEAYYREKFIPQLKEPVVAEVPSADVAAKIRELLTQEKVNELLVSWLQSLRSESKVSVPGSAGVPDGVQTR